MTNQPTAHPPGTAESRVYAIEADPGKCTASFPTFDTLNAARQAADVPAFAREGLPPPRVLVRVAGRGWKAVRNA